MLYGLFLSFTGKGQRTAHREFLKALIEFLFLYNSEKYAENVPGTSFKEYPKYSYTSHKSGRKPQFPDLIPTNYINLS
jgi:hypothetical protein